MSKALPNPGTYLAKRNGAIVIEESKEGALLAWVPYALCAPGVEHIGKHMVVLVQKDGQLSNRNIATLRRIWPAWDGIDMFALETLDLPADGAPPEFELADCFHDEYVKQEGEPPTITFKAQWLNAIGGTQNMPAPMDESKRKAIRTKFLSKFKAAAASTGGAPATSAPKQAPAAASSPAPAQASSGAKPAAKSAGPPSRGKAGSPATAATPRTATLEEVWGALEKVDDGRNQNDKAAAFYAACDKVTGTENVDAATLNPAQWGEVANELGL